MTRSIVVTGDCLRPNPDGSLGGINIQTVWLKRLVDRQLFLATGIAPRQLLLDSLTGIDAIGFYKRRGIVDRMAVWAAIYDGTQFFGEIVALYEPFVRDAIVIGFELPLYLQRVLEHLEVPYVDLWVHPIRFLDDLLFGVRSTIPASDEAIGRHAISEEEVWMTAGLRRATAATGIASILEPNSTLVLGQLRIDKSQIRKGQFVDVAKFDGELLALPALKGPWLIKPHPYSPDHPLLDRVRELVPTARTINDNVYHLLAHDEIARVVSLNSSSAIEARYFGKEVSLLLPPVIEVAYRGGRPGSNVYWSLNHVILDADFWRDALAPCLRTTPHDGFRHPPKPNRFRISLRTFWGFQQIDSDIFVNLGKPTELETSGVAPIEVVGQSVNLLPALTSVTRDTIRENRRVLIPRRDEPHIELFGPYFPLQPGRYRLTIDYRLLSDSPSCHAAFGVDVCHNFGKSTILPRQECNGSYESTFEFDIIEPVAAAETRVWSGSQDVIVNSVRLEFRHAY